MFSVVFAGDSRLAGWLQGSRGLGSRAPGLQLLGVSSSELHGSQLRERDIDTGSAFQILSIKLVIERTYDQQTDSSEFLRSVSGTEVSRRLPRAC